MRCLLVVCLINYLEQIEEELGRILSRPLVMDNGRVTKRVCDVITRMCRRIFGIFFGIFEPRVL